MSAKTRLLSALLKRTEDLGERLAAKRAARFAARKPRVPSELSVRAGEPLLPAFGTYEQIPYISSGHLPEVSMGDDALRAKYAADPRSTWTDRKGRDVVYRALGVPQRATRPSTGVYQSPGGPLEVNPANVAQPRVQVEEGAVDPASRNALSAAEAVRAYIDAQGAGAWHAPIRSADPADMGSVFVPMREGMSPEAIAAARTIGEKYGVGDVIDTGRGATLTNFGGAPSGADTDIALRTGLTRDLREVLGNAVPQRAKIDSDYLPMFEVGTAPGSGEVTRNLFQLLEQYGEAPIEKLSQSEAIRQKALANAARDEEFGTVRSDIQRAREIIGREGLQGLRDALKRGEILPVGLGALLSAYGLSEDGEPVY